MNDHRAALLPAIQRGFTVVEALVAFVILAVGLLAILSFHSATQRTNSDAKIQAEATALAEEKLMEIQSFLTEGDSRLGDGNDSPQGLLAGYQRAWTVAEGDSPQVMIARVTVDWTDRNGDGQEVAIESAVHVVDPALKVSELLNYMYFTKIIAEQTADGGFIPDPAGAGGREVVAEIPVGEYQGDIPADYPETTVKVYRIYIFGNITTGGSASSEDGTIIAPTVEVVTGDTVLQYEPECQWTATSYSCTLYYLSTTVGWQGSITYQASAGGNNSPRFCRPTTTNPVYPANTSLSDQYDFLVASTNPAPNTGTFSYVVNFNPITVSTVANVEVRSNACPQ